MLLCGLLHFRVRQVNIDAYLKTRGMAAWTLLYHLQYLSTSTMNKTAEDNECLPNQK